MLGTHLGHYGNYPNLAKAANSTFSDLTLDLKQHKLMHILHVDNNPMLVLHNYDASQFTEFNDDNSPV